MKEFSQSSGEALPAETGEEFTRMDRRLLVPSLTNRPPIALGKLQSMAATMDGGRGVRQALIIRPLPGARLQETRLNTPKGQPLPTHEIVCGEQRWLAAGIGAINDVPVIIRDLTDAEALEEQFVENFQRQNFTELEEGEGFQRLMHNNKLTADEVAVKAGCSRRHVFNRIKLLDLRIEARKALLDGDIDATRALLLARIPDHQQQIKALPLLKKHQLTDEYTLTVREARDMLERDFMLEIGKAQFKTTDITLVEGAGSCSDCHKRTGHNPDLFADIKGANICTDPPCFQRKQAAHETRVLQQAHANGQTVITGREAKALMPNSFGGIEGYLRLDDPKDSPTEKPLRKLIGKQLEADGIKPTLVENPHNKGELIAVLPADKVSELLKKRGHKDAASALDNQTATDTYRQAEVDKARDKAEKLHAYEQGWRDEVLAQTYAEICDPENPSPGVLTDEVLRIIAGRLASQANGEQTRQLCALLGLGKIAPRDALTDHCRTADRPEGLVLLLVMHHDAAFKDFQPDPAVGNTALMQVANDYGIDVQAIKAGVKQAMRAKTSSKVQAADAGEPSSPALHSKGEGGTKPKGKSPTRTPKTSKEEASQGIADAMQNLEEVASVPDAGTKARAWPFPLDPPADYAAPLAKGEGLAVGQRITVAAVDMLRAPLSRFAGLPGTVTQPADADGEWEVKLDKGGRGGGVRLFLAHEIESAS